MEFITHLKNNAFDNLQIEPDYTPDLQGWMDPAFLDTAKQALEHRDRNAPLVIVEVGTWKGLSALNMAQITKDLGFKEVHIITIDTWLGGPEFWTKGANDKEFGQSLKITNGYPSVFYTFTKNAKALGYHDIIAPLPLSSGQGATVLEYYGIKADLIYVDAAHEYEAVKADIKAYWGLLKDGGVMLGDDYSSSWIGVIRAVEEFALENGLRKTVDGAVWRLAAVAVAP